MDPGATTPRTSTARNDDTPDVGGKTLANDTPPKAPSAHQGDGGADDGEKEKTVKVVSPDGAVAGTTAGAVAPAVATTTTTREHHACLPIRILEDFDVREKADEKNLVALTSAMKPSDLVVFGKARKLEGGENEAPSTLLMKKLQPQMRPPHPLKLVDVLDWCVSYDEVEGGTYSIWLVTPRAWYKLGQPGVKYAATYAQTRRRAMFASLFKKCIEEDWECSFTKVLETMKNAPRVEYDVKEKKESMKKEKEDAEGTDGEPEEEEEDKDDDEDNDGNDEDDDEDDDFSYSEKEIKKDGFFVCAQVEHLVKSGVLLPPGTEASKYGKPYTGKLPWCLISFSRWTMIANRLARQKKDRVEMEIERKERAIQRAKERAERKELKLAQKEAEKQARAEARALALKKSKEPIVIPPRIADPTKCSRAIDEFPWASPAIVGEVLSMWDVVSVYETIFYVPTTTLRKFAHAFLSKPEDCTPSDALLVQDVIIGSIRAIEARDDAVDSSETTRRNSKLGFTEARSIQDPTIGLQDLAALNWRQLAIDMITEFLPATSCNPRVRTGAKLAVQKLQELMMYDADNVYASDLDAGLRVSLASALVIIAADSEGFHDYEMQKIEEVRDKKRQALGSKAFDVGIPIVIPEESLRIPIVGGAKQEDIKEGKEEKNEETKPVSVTQSLEPPNSTGRVDKRRTTRCGYCHTCLNRQLRQACITRRKEDEAMGIFPGDQSTKKNTAAEMKAPIIEDPNMRRPKDDNEKCMLWMRQAGRWYRDNDDRQIWRHGRPVAVDARGRRYFQLGGRNGSGMLFVESPLPSWHVKTPKPKEEKKATPDKVKKEEVDQEDGEENDDEDNEDNDSEGEEEKEVEPAGPPVDDGEYTDNYLTDLPVANIDHITMNIPGVYESASNWGVVYPNEELIQLAKWCDPNYPHEKYICRWANLVSRSALGETYDNVTSEILDKEETRVKFKEFIKSIDGEYNGYAKIDEKYGNSKEAVFGDAHAKALKLVSVAQYLLHSTPFWVQDYRWTEKFLECDQELTNIIEHAPEAVVLQRLMKAFLLLEAVCRTSQVMDPQWQNSRQSWIAKVKKFIKKSPEGTGDGSAKDEEFGGDDEAMMDDNVTDIPLNVTSAAALLHKLVVLQLTDPARLSAHTFAFSDAEGLGKHASQIKTGDFVMLCMKGYRDTKKAHLSDELIPPHFVDTTLLHEYERCIVKATAFRGAEEHEDGHVDEPWAWFLLELIDEPTRAEARKAEQMRSSRALKKKKKKYLREPANSDEEFERELQETSSDEEDAAEEKRRLLACPLIPSGQVGDYIITLEQYEKGQSLNWKNGDRVMMHFPDGEEFEDIDRGIVEDENETDPSKKIKYLGKVTKVKKGDPFDGVTVVWDSEKIDAENSGDAAPTTSVSAWELERAPKDILKKTPRADRDLMAHMREPMMAYKPSQPGSRNFVRRQSTGDKQDKQPVYIIHRFDFSEGVRRMNCDIYGPASGRIASPYLTRTGNLASDPMPYHATNEIMALKKQATDLAIALGWNEQGVREQKFIDQFNVLKMKVPIQHGTGVNLTFCREPLDLYALFVEALYQGGYNSITREKLWKSVARGLRVDLSGQTSASFALRVKYEQYLRDLEYLVRETGVPEPLADGVEPVAKFEEYLEAEKQKPDPEVKRYTTAARDKENQQWRELDIHKGLITRAKADKETAAIRPKYAKRFPDLFNEELLASNRDQCLKDEPANQVKVRVIRLESILHKTYEFLDAVESEDPEDFKHHEATLGLTKPKQSDVKMEDAPPVKAAATSKKRKAPEKYDEEEDEEEEEEEEEDDEDDSDFEA